MSNRPRNRLTLSRGGNQRPSRSDCGRSGALPLYTSHGHAQVSCVRHDDQSAWVQDLEWGIGYLCGDAVLHLQTPRKHVHHRTHLLSPKHAHQADE